MMMRTRAGQKAPAFRDLVREAGERPLRARLPDARTILVCLFTVAALVLGGGGTPAPRQELILQIVAAVAVAAWVFLPRVAPRPLDRGIALLALLVVLLPAIQLIPLPPAIWQSLPGRELERQALDLVGAGGTWRPWTISPALTLASLLAVLPPVAAMLMVSRLDLRGRKLVVAAIAVMGLLSLVIGTLQLSAGPASAVTFYPGSFGRVFGFQANRNAEVDVLMIALVAIAATYVGAKPGRGIRVPAWRQGPVLAVAAAASGIVIVLGAVLTGSRAGIAILPAALLFAAVLVYPPNLPLRKVIPVLGGAILSLCLAAYLLRHNAALARVTARFAGEEDFRFELWADTLYQVKQFWPLGSGMGTIVPVLIAGERLEVVDTTLPNRAHCDYLELALEGGVPGLLLLALAAVLLVALAWRAWRARDAASAPLVLFAGATIIVIALHSVVDYPLRSMALAHLAGVAAGLFVPFRRHEGRSGKMRESEA